MWQTLSIYSAILIVKVYILDEVTAWDVSDYFLITLYPTLFPYEGLLKHFIYFIASSSALFFQLLQADSCV